MKQNILSSIRVAFFAAWMVGLLASCHGIYDDLAPCSRGVRLRFVYDYNMEYANSFPKWVDCLTLFVYDEQGNYVGTYTGMGDELKDENYRMTIDLEQGNYHFIAYGGLSCAQTSFSFRSVPAPGLQWQDLRVEMHDAGRVSTTNLHPLFWGTLDINIDADTYKEGTVHLMKNTNNIRVVLQHISGKPVDDKDFTFRITDDNTLFAADNSLIPNGTQVYAPWAQGCRTTGVTESGDAEVTVAYAELSTSRLVRENRPRLVISRKSDSKPVVDIPLNEYLLLLKSDRFHEMGDQEFLDRESDWSMVFFLDDSNNQEWIRTHIVVNDWVVRLNDIGFN
ncbi:FimB/Mfa2 family fimbrial subunit [uncultured Phocaeicola sp.]|uniref:FimB/Mfa2 family fimbrial subunit n=1 Tax=uncultured Phocaeicola sp. TaxID=990718 RepID=UPI0014349CF1|nr:FimB/Mfa2 family fimbrial subunit [uncultured Phocaeicola sp.]GFI01050.1 hypothetical protein IMSAGC004_03461 [Bacteroidaceae bacterium]